MLNKKDPLIDAIQQVMQNNQADRDAVKAVNEKFGILDRKVLPHERQGEWDTAYHTVLSEGVEALDEKLVGKQSNIDANKNGKVDGGDFPLLKKGVRPMAEAEKMKGKDPCWDTHKMVGMKKGKGGKPVPNCVPVSEEGDPSKAIPGDTVTGGSSVTKVPPKPKAKSITPEQQNALTNKIKSIKEAKKAAMCEDTLQEKSASVQAAGAKPTAPAPAAAPAASAMSGSQARTGGNPTSAPAARPAMSGSQARTGGNPTSAPAARPAVGGARPSVVAKNSYSGAQKSTGAQVGGARPSVVAKNSPSQKPYQSGAGAMTNPTQRPYDAKTSPTAKAPATTGSKVIKPVRKQTTAGTAKPAGGGVPTRPVKKSNVLDRVRANRQRDKNNDVGP